MASDPVEVRQATQEDLRVLPSIEDAADSLFATIGIELPAGPADVETLDGSACVLVAGDPPLGFAVLDVVDGDAHLGQMSVHPDAARRGIGTALLTAAVDWATAQGFRAITLTTFRDVPWNAPFYARHGFREPDAMTPGLAAQRQHEREYGMDALGPRVAMRRDLP